jgi:CheY-like chemotaxis protein
MAARVLIVDDDPFNTALLGDICRSGGFEVAVAGDGEEALERARAEAPDAVLLDLMMPRLDGFGTCLKMKADPVLRPIPVLIITAVDDVASRLKGLEVGADDYLTKPFRPLDVLGRIKEALHVRSSADAVPMLPAGVGDFSDLRRDLAGETSRANRYRRPLCCAVVLPRPSGTPYGLERRRWIAEHAAQLLVSLRGSDRIYLLGTEEIVVLLPECDGSGIEAALGRIRVALGAEARSFYVGAVGYEGGDPAELVRRGLDTALGAR